PECVLAVAGAARNDPLAIAERGSELAVRLAVGPDRLVDAVAAVDSGLARWAERAAGARRRDAAMALDRKIAAVAQAQAVGGAALELLSFRGTRAERAKGRGWIGIGVGGRRRPAPAAEQRLEEALRLGGTGRQHQRHDSDGCERPGLAGYRVGDGRSSLSTRAKRPPRRSQSGGC